MKFRTLLLASAAVMVAAPAFASDDITAAFYTPAQGKFLSDTSLEMTRMRVDDGALDVRAKGVVASEELTYGVNDNLAVFGTVTNYFKPTAKAELAGVTAKDRDYNNDHNFEYDLGVKYNYNWGKVLGQAVLGYQTFDPRSWYGTSGEDDDYQTNRWEKSLNAEVKLGYALDCGLTPYTTFRIDGTIDRADRDQEYSWFLGAHKMLDKVSLDAGVRYDFDNTNEAWYLQAEANYFVKENVTVGVYGEYYLGGSPVDDYADVYPGKLTRHDVNYDYTLGLNAKVAF